MSPYVTKFTRKSFLTVPWDLRAYLYTPNKGVLLLVPEPTYKARLRAPRRSPCQLKNPFRGLRPRRDSLWKERRRIISSLFCLPGKYCFFTPLALLISFCLRPSEQWHHEMTSKTKELLIKISFYGVKMRVTTRIWC